MPGESPYIPGEKRKVDSALANYQVNPQFASWEVGKKYLVQRILGKGSYGQVALAIDRCDAALFHDLILYPQT